MPALRIQLLGDFRMVYAGQPVSGMASPRLRSLLAFLVLHRHAPQSRKHLACLLWQDSSEAQAHSNLRNLLHRLRAALPDAERVLIAKTHTLQWRPEAPLALDVDEFEQAAARGDSIPALQAAATVYRGALLPACYDEWLLPERERLHELYVNTLARLALLLEQRRDHDAAIGYARRLLRADPLREEAYRQLMRLYAWRGDRAAVARVYHTCVTVLQRELHAEPSLLTRQTFEQLRTAEVPAERSGAVRGTPGNHNLPVQLTSFIGRARALGEITPLLLQKRLLTLTGAGGCGKTRLALQVAQGVVDAFTDGVWFVDLAPLSNPTLVPQTVAAALGIRERQGPSFTETLVDYLQSQELLLVLDNCEHLLTACAQLTEVLLRACPRVTVLATSRERLNLAGETVWLVPSLSLPDTQGPVWETLASSDAGQLFSERAALGVPTFTLNAANAAAVAQICRRLDGIPLAIELAAACVRTLTPGQIAARLDDALHVLTRGTKSVPPRHHTMRAAMDWSYNLLAEKERVFFRRLSVFAGGFTLEAAEAVCTDAAGPHGIASHHVLDMLCDLVDKSLVLVVDGGQGEPARYRLLEPLRQYAREKLHGSGELGPLSRRHLVFFLALVEEADAHLRGAEQRVWLERLDGEHDNLRAALAWSLSRAGEGETGLRLASALLWFWRRRGYVEEGRRWLEEALQSPAAAAGTKARAKVCYAAGTMALLQVRHAMARARLMESVTLWRELGDTPGLAYALGQLGRVAWAEGNYEEWRSLHAQSTALFREVGDKWGLAFTLTSGLVAEPERDLARLRSCLEESVALWRELGDHWGFALALNSLGEVARYEGKYQQAAGFYEESITLKRALGNKRDLALSLHNLGHALQRLGASRRAARQFQEGLVLFLEIGDHSGVAACLVGLAGASGGAGQRERAARLFGAGEALFEASSARLDPVDRLEYDRNLAAVRAALDAATFAAARAAGRALTMEQAVAYALQGAAET
jgi:predicted ATPase/DNA-binding SARP family transcriptional activator